MKLKSFGCSFIFGSDLSDDGRNGLYATGSKLTWPALLAKDSGYDYSTYARPGSGNLQILERLLNQIDNETSLYVIGWTWINRFDYIDPNMAYPWPGTKWKTLMPIDETPISKTYFKNLHSEFQDKFTALVYIKTAIDALKKSHSRFIMTGMDSLVWDRRWHINTAISDLQDYCRPYFNDFEGENFLDWSRQQGFIISDMLHPLEDAHQAAADLIIKDLDSWIKT